MPNTQNILYIGPYKEQNGLGKASKRFVDSLISNTNINLAIRPIFYTKPSEISFFNNEPYTEFEENSFKYYDSIIQHGYPGMFEYHKNFGKNIGICQIETKNITHTGWIDKINLLDEVITHSVFSINSLIDSGVKIPTRILPEPYDIKKYDISYQDFFSNKDKNKPYIFYTIGNYFDKNNLKGIILAYILEFNHEDNVQLFIKTSHPSIHNDELKKIIEYEIDNIKKTVRKNNIPDIDVLCGYIDDTDIVRLHQGADCYLNTVKCDSFGSSAIEALLCNNLVINTKNIGSNTYINNHNGIIVNSIPMNIYSKDYFDANTFTIYEEWYEPNIKDIRDSMRLAYEMNSETLNNKKDFIDKSIFDKSIIGRSII